MKKKVAILGSTGSIGENSLRIFNKKKKFQITILVANKNYKKICSQINSYKPKFFIIDNFEIYNKVKNKFKNNSTQIIHSLNYKNKNFKKLDITVAAIPGIAGLEPTLSFIKKSKKILILLVP